MSATTLPPVDPVASTSRIADTVAAVHADAVDRDGRFPAETVAALRDERLLGASVPVALGGAGATVAELAECCYQLGRRCGASAMVFAMHHAQVACLVRHHEPGDGIEDALRRIAAEQRLVASATSEIGTGGDLGRSVAALVRASDGSLSFEKRAPTVSYGAHADELLTTLRRAEDADARDQVLVLTSREETDLEQTGSWDVMGMRGTCSPGFVVRGRPRPEHVVPVAFAEIAARTMVPVSHVLWSHVWLGIATDAFERARASVRAALRRAPDGGGPAAGGGSPAAARLAGLHSRLAALRAEVRLACADFAAMDANEEADELGKMSGALRFNTLKLIASENALGVCLDALSVIGVAGYRNDTPVSVARHIRDAASAPLMVANDRLRDVGGSMLLLAKGV